MLVPIEYWLDQYPISVGLRQLAARARRGGRDRYAAVQLGKHLGARVIASASPGEMADIEGPAAYLASDVSRLHTGDILVIDGGRIVKSL